VQIVGSCGIMRSPTKEVHMDAVHTLPPDATILERALFRKGQRHADAGWTLCQMREYSDSVLARRGFTFYDAYWTGVDSILEG